MNTRHTVSNASRVPAIAMAAAMVWISPALVRSAIAAPPATMPAATDTHPATQSGDWNQRIDAALRATGGVDSIAAELAGADGNQPEVLQARIRVALEQGNLDAALPLLEQAAASGSTTAAALERLAHVQEMLGRTAIAQQTLARAAAIAQKPADIARLTLRGAALAFDAGRSADAIKLLDQAAQLGPDFSIRGGVIAYLYGDFATAARLLGATPQSSTAINLLCGDADLATNQTSAASVAFGAALSAASETGDKTYATDRLIAAARQAGTLDQLASAWLKQKELPSERLLPLAVVLRELNRVPELLTWWRARSADAAPGDVIFSDRFVNEVLGAAQSAGRSEDVIAICRQQLSRSPESGEWQNATLRALSNAGQADQMDALLRERIKASAEVPQQLQRYGQLAQTFGRDTVAIEAADSLTSFGGATAIAGRLLAASIYQHASDQQKLDAVLQQAAQAAADHPDAVQDVASALESAGHDDQAVSLLQQAIKTDPSDANLGRLASLLIKSKQYDEATPVLTRIMRMPASTAVRGQAEQRLLECATATGQVNQLITDLRARLAAGQGDTWDLSLLVDAEVSIHKVSGAVDALQHTTLLDEPAKLRQLAVLFLRQKQLDRADGALRKLLAADPASATDTLERLASVAIARGRTNDAIEAVKQLRQQAGSGQAAGTMMAGVLARLGHFAESAAEFRKLLVGDSDESEDWLLWANAMQRAGSTNVARQRLQVLCSEAANDNAFAVAADGLLNLSASPDALRAARRDGIIRLVEQPGQMMLYHVLTDLSEELADTDMIVRATQASVAVSHEERPQRLRQLMDVATQNGRVNTAVDCGRTLLAIGDDFPPQLFLQLGQQLLVAGRLPDAQRAFARASEVSDPDTIGPRAAKMLELYSQPMAALDTLRPLADLRKKDADFVEHIASLQELVGETPRAFENYLSLIDSSSQPPAVDEAPDAPRMQPPMPGKYFTTRALERQAVAAILCAQSPQDQERVLSLLESRIKTWVASSQSDVPTPKLIELADTMRHIAALANQPKRAIETDGQIAAHWPRAANNFNSGALQSRLLNGFVADAYAFANANQVKSDTLLQRYAQAIDTQPTTLPAQVTASWATGVLPGLIMNGKLDEARQVLSSVETPEHSAPSAGSLMANSMSTFRLRSYCRILTMAAAALGDSAAESRWMGIWIDVLDRKPMQAPVVEGAPTPPAGRAPYSQLPSQYASMNAAVWRVLSPEVRAQVVQRMRKDMPLLDNPVNRSVMAASILQLSAELPSMPDEAAQLGIDAVVGQQRGQAETAGRVFSQLPSADRPAFLRGVFAKMPGNRRLAFLTATLSRVVGRLDEQTIATLKQIVESMPDGQDVEWGDWFANIQQPEVLRLLAGAMLSKAAQNDDQSQTAVLTAAAAALASAGENDQADAAAAQALKLLARNNLEPATQSAQPAQAAAGRSRSAGADVLPVLAAALSPKARVAELAKIDAFVATPAGQSNELRCLSIKAALESAAGDRDQALAVLRLCVTRDPNSPQLLGAYIARLQDDGRMAELAKRSGQFKNSDALPDSLKKAGAEALRSLYRSREAINDLTASHPISDFATPLAMHDASALAITMRQVTQQMRTTGGPFIIVMPPRAGGLTQSAAGESNDAPSSLADIAQWPGALDDLLRTLHVPNLPDASANWLSAVAVQAAHDEAVRKQIFDHLAPAIAAGTLTPGERALVAGIAEIPGVTVPPSILDALRPAAIINDAEFKQLASVWIAQKRSGAQGLAHWARVLSTDTGMRMPQAAPTTLENKEDANMAWWLSSLADRDPAEAARQYAALVAIGHLTPRSIACRLVGARLAASKPESGDYKAMLQSIVTDWAWQQALSASSAAGQDAGPSLEMSLAVPNSEIDAAHRSAALTVIRTVLIEAADRWPGLTDLSRQLAAVGAQTLAQNDRASAESFYTAAKTLAAKQGPGEHQLWVADLAERLGRAAESDEIQTNLLTEHCLPAVRIPPLLNRLRDAGHSDVADRLLADAKTYCNLPSPSSSATAWGNVP